MESTPLKFSDEQKRVFKANQAPNATADQWAYFIDECERRALVPGTHVVFSLRNAQEYDTITQQWVSVKKVAFITTINALRLLTDRYSTAHPDRAFKGYGRFKYYYGVAESDDFSEKDIPLAGKIPHAVSVTVRRKDWEEPLFVVARYDACVQTKKKGQQDVPTAMWEKRGPEQTAKCCEAMALRAIAPEELGGLYLSEELEATLEQPETTAAAAATPVVTPPAPMVAPAVNQAPATAQMAAPSSFGGLFDGTTPPPKEAETTVFPPEAFAAPTPTEATVAVASPEPFVATDADLPAILSEPAPVPAPVPVAPAPPEKPCTPVPAVIPPASGEATPSSAEYQGFMARVTTVWHNIVQKGLYKGSNSILQTYLLRDTGKTRLNKLTRTEFLAKVDALEAATPEVALTLIKGDK